MTLKFLLENVQVKSNFAKFENLDIHNIAFDTKDVKSGSLFFCLKGLSTDGHDFLPAAKKAGAVAAVVEQFVEGVDLPQILVSSTRKALSLVCANFYDNPQKHLKLVAIVGTNGKTTTTQILKHIFMQANQKVGVIGTLGYFINNQKFALNLTTPDPTKLYQILAQFKQQGVKYVFMEVSAHAIWLDKVHGLSFEVGALTNITQDHLDFFKTMENYSKTKIDFLKSNQIKLLVVNADCEYYSSFLNTETVTYGIKNPSDSFALDIVLGLGQTSYALNLLDNIMLVKTCLSGMFNVYNALCAATISLLLGLDVAAVKKGLESIEDINGRFNVMLTNKGKIVLDFAHTPDGLENILKAVQVSSNFCDIVCVFGANGNKDVSKRKIMGKISERYCKKVYLTSDDPKYENIEIIFDDILEQVQDRQKFFKIADRKQAIRLALGDIDQQTIIVLCGKAGETTQDINGVLVPYDEKQVVEQLMHELNIEKL